MKAQKDLASVFKRNKYVKDMSSTDVLRDFSDGSAFQENPYFKKNPGAFAAHFYSDAMEIYNPLGWAKVRHKIVHVFYTIGSARSACVLRTVPTT